MNELELAIGDPVERYEIAKRYETSLSLYIDQLEREGKRMQRGPKKMARLWLLHETKRIRGNLRHAIKEMADDWVTIGEPALKTRLTLNKRVADARFIKLALEAKIK